MVESHGRGVPRSRSKKPPETWGFWLFCDVSDMVAVGRVQADRPSWHLDRLDTLDTLDRRLATYIIEPVCAPNETFSGPLEALDPLSIWFPEAHYMCAEGPWPRKAARPTGREPSQL